MYPISLGGDITVTIRSMVCGSINKKIKSSFALSVKKRKKERKKETIVIKWFGPRISGP